MNLNELLKRRLVEEVNPDQQLINNEIEIAEGDVISAKNMLEIEEFGWAHNAAFNAMLQASRALMFAKGYRAMSQEHHVAVISFMDVVYGAKLGRDLIQTFDRARKKRNESIYDTVGNISESQCKNLVSKAEIFVSKTKELIIKLGINLK